MKYLRFLRDRYFSGPELSPLDRTLFTFAAYNAGPGNVIKSRKRAERMGLDPNVWLDNVEIAAAKAISREPVVYVRNIYRYHVAYKLLAEDRTEIIPTHRSSDLRVARGAKEWWDGRGRTAAMPALAIRQDLPADELRRLARREPDRRAAMRLLAIANALDGFSRAEAARLAGMERQALRDAVVRYNAEGPDGLHDRPRSGRPEALTPGQQAALKAWVLRGPEPGAGRGERLAPGRRLRPCRAGLRRALQRLGHVAPAAGGSGSRARRPDLGTRRAARPSGPRSKKELGSKLADIAASPSGRAAAALVRG